MDNKYKQGKIYKLICTETLDLYIGSTIETLKERLRKHRGKCNGCKSKNFIDPVIELIEDYPCNNKRELEKREQYYIDNNECVNLKNSYTSKEERKEYDKKYSKEYYPKYYLENKDDYNKKRKEKFKCECGSIYRKSDKARHERTKKHLDFKPV